MLATVLSQAERSWFKQQVQSINNKQFAWEGAEGVRSGPRKKKTQTHGNTVLWTVGHKHSKYNQVTTNNIHLGVEDCNRLPTEAVVSPSLEIFKTHLDAILCHVLNDVPFWARRLDQMTPCGTFQPLTCCDSVNCSWPQHSGQSDILMIYGVWFAWKKSNVIFPPFWQTYKTFKDAFVISKTICSHFTSVLGNNGEMLGSCSCCLLCR